MSCPHTARKSSDGVSSWQAFVSSRERGISPRLEWGSSGTVSQCLCQATHLDEVGVALERLAGVAEVALLAGELPDEEGLVARGGHDHVVGVRAGRGVGGGRDGGDPAVVGLEGSAESQGLGPASRFTVSESPSHTPRPFQSLLPHRFLTLSGRCVVSCTVANIRFDSRNVRSQIRVLFQFGLARNLGQGWGGRRNDKAVEGRGARILQYCICARSRRFVPQNVALSTPCVSWCNCAIPLRPHNGERCFPFVQHGSQGRATAGTMGESIGREESAKLC